MPEEKLGQILRSVAQRMRADFNQSRVFNHNGEAGTAREFLVDNFLASYLPAHVQTVHNAEVIAASGDVSSQCDIAVINRGTPPLTALQGFRVIPNECVYGVLEVKTTLNRNELFDACEKIAILRQLQKTAYREVPNPIKRTTTAYGETFPYFPTSGIVVAFESVNLETLGNHLEEWCASRPVSQWPDSVWVLGKGYLQWLDRGKKLARTPTPGCSLVKVDSVPEDDILLPLVLHLNIHFSEAWMHPLDLLPYAGSLPLGTITQEWFPG